MGYLDYWNTQQLLPVSEKGDCKGRMQECSLKEPLLTVLTELPQSLQQTIHSEFAAAVGGAALAMAERNVKEKLKKMTDAADTRNHVLEAKRDEEEEERLACEEKEEEEEEEEEEV